MSAYPVLCFRRMLHRLLLPPVLPAWTQRSAFWSAARESTRGSARVHLFAVWERLLPPEAARQQYILQVRQYIFGCLLSCAHRKPRRLPVCMYAVLLSAVCLT